MSLARETRRLADAVVAAGLDTEVPTAPGWDVARLARHVGHAHRWAEAVVRTGEPVAPTAVDDRTPPMDAEGDADGVAAWLHSGADQLQRALDAHHPGTEVWSWSDEATPAFWARWAVHETLLRRVDVELAAGLPAVVDPATAVEGIDHWLGIVTLDDGGVHPLAGTGEAIHLHATDAAGEWLLTRGADGPTWSHGHTRADVAVRGPVADLLLVLLRRSDVGSVQVLGDAVVLTDLLADLPL